MYYNGKERKSHSHRVSDSVTVTSDIVAFVSSFGRRRPPGPENPSSSSVLVHHSKLNIVVPAHAYGNKLKVVIIMLICPYTV